VLSQHPAWGYVDQSALTPMIARAGIEVLGDNLWALRIPAMACALGVVALTAVLSAELGGGARAQLLAAVGTSSTFVLVCGHVLLTASVDLVVWAAVILCTCRALLRDQPRWWVGAGLAVGIGTYNKQLIVLLLLGLLAGLLLAGPRRVLGDRWLWAGVGIAVLLSVPNLAYQAINGWPELAMARALAAHKGPDDRVLLVPFQLIVLGLTVVPIWVAGLLAAFRRPLWRPVRAVAVAYPVVLLVVLVSGGQPYYPFGLVAFGYAAGCVVVEQWAYRRPARWVAAWVAVGVTVGVAAVVALPLIPVGSLPPAVAAANQTARDSIGWPTYVSEVATVYWSLPATDRARTVLLAQNYGEAGALDKYGPDHHLPNAFSGQNQLFSYGPPPDSASVVVAVGYDSLEQVFTSCTVEGTLDNHLGVDNEEQGRAVQVCREPRGGWAATWPSLRHLD
jgi:4-amino-4-deoxy-L-arabinose transferase-like glycosyltransferase